ncbi:hypothetical protein SRHO_G00219630 [Serrasalmus rhombeus]
MISSRFELCCGPDWDQKLYTSRKPQQAPGAPLIHSTQKQTVLNQARPRREGKQTRAGSSVDSFQKNKA